MVSKQVYNEQLKLISSTFQNLAIALLVVTVGVAWNDGFLPYLLLWAAMTVVFFALAHATLRNLEDHES